MSSLLRLLLLMALLHPKINHAHEQQDALAERLLENAYLLQPLQYQLTAANISSEDLVRDPALFHNFRELTTTQATIRINDQQALWLLVKLQNPYAEPWQAVLYYPFLPADRVSFYRLQPEIPTVQLLSKTGNVLPFSERQLPLRGYSQGVMLNPNEQLSILIRLQDAALLGTALQLSSLNVLLAQEQRQLVQEALLLGVLLMLVLLTLWVARLRGEWAYLWLAGFYFSFTLVVSVLNGIAFTILWPSYPELNPVMLYISVGCCLLSLACYSRQTLLSQSGRLALLLNTVAIVSALLLLFSPLYADGVMKLKLLFISVSVTLTLCIVQALLVSLTTDIAGAPRYALLCALATLCLLLVQTRHLSGFVSGLTGGLIVLIGLSALVVQQLACRSHVD